MRPAFSSRTKRRGATALATALRLFLTDSDMWHPYGDLTRNWSALDRDCAANTCHDIEWDDRRWNSCASSSLSYGAARPCCALTQFAREGYFLAPVYDRFTEGFCDCGHADRASTARLAPAASSVTLICWRWPCAKFALGITFRLQTSGDSPVAADRRSRAVEHEASGQRRTTWPHAGVLVKDPVQPVRCAGVSAMEGRLDTASDS